MGEIKLIADKMPNILPMTGRSHDGIHVSEVIHDLCVRLGHYTPRDDEEWNQAQLELGNAFERSIIDRLEEHSKGRYFKPGELELDNIYGTPDLIDVTDEAVHEMKCTWASSRHQYDHEGPKLWKYWLQLRSYCHMLGWTTGRLHVMFVNGGYTYDKGSGPEYRCWEQKFTKKELEQNWNMIRRRAEDLAVTKGVPPPRVRRPSTTRPATTTKPTVRPTVRPTVKRPR